MTHTPIPSKGIINAVQRHETAAFFKDIHEESFLSAVQGDILNRLLIVSNTTINRVMISIKKTQLISVNATRHMILDIVKKYEFTRLPVYETTQDNIIGFIDVYDVLYSKKKIAGLYDFVKPIKKIPQKTLVTNAMEVLQAEKEKIALVVRVVHKNHEIPVGIITMKESITTSRTGGMRKAPKRGHYGLVSFLLFHVFLVPGFIFGSWPHQDLPC